MKLYPIIYEAARTAEEALDKRIAALQVQRTSESPQRVILFHKGRTFEAITKAANEMDGIWDADPALKQRAFVGTVGYVPQFNEKDLYKVTTSAGVSKFGPLAYQITMYAIKPYWLKSDNSLSEGEHGSSNVWNQMYARPETYERKWLGDFKTGMNMLSKAMIAVDEHYDLFKEYRKSEEIKSEESVKKFLEEHNKNMAEFGHFYAYRIINPDPKIQDMFDAGETFLDDLENRGFDVVEVKKLLDFSSQNFFARRYK